MECIIIDDEKMARVITRTLSEEISELKVVDEFSNAIQAIKFLNENQIDLIFLDLHMPDFNGLDFLKTINKPLKIILTTSDPNFAIEAFEYDSIIDYLLKPIELPRFIKAVQKAENHLSIAHRNTEDIKTKNDILNQKTATI